MNKKTSFKFNRTKASQRREMEGDFVHAECGAGQQLAIMQNTATLTNPSPTRPKSMEEADGWNTAP